VFEIITDFFDFDLRVRAARGHVRRKRRPMSITTIQLGLHPPGHWTRLLKAIEKANDEGVELRGQVAARPVGLIMSPRRPCASVARGGRAIKQSCTFRSQATRAAASARSATGDHRRDVGRANDDGTDDNCPTAFPLGPTGELRVREADSIKARADELGVTPAEVAYDALWPSTAKGASMFPSPTSLIATSSSHARCSCIRSRSGSRRRWRALHIISDASFATFLLTHWARDARAERTHPGRGSSSNDNAPTPRAWSAARPRIVAPGYKADLNIIDFDNLSIGRPENDLRPARQRQAARTTGHRLRRHHRQWCRRIP
jgi:N-acyl-D-aspartate/D-glutamate deacylase